MMSPKKSDIPGFYRDPLTGKYYREKPDDMATSESMKKIKDSVAAEQLKAIKDKPRPIRNTLTYLRERELAGKNGFLSIHSYYGMRIGNKTLKCDVDLNMTQVKCPDIAEVEYIKASPAYVYGVWKRRSTTENCSYVFGHIDMNGAEAPKDIEFYYTNKYIVDICQNISGTCAFVSNCPKTGLGSCHLVWRTNFNTEVYDHFHSMKTTLFSCAHAVVDDTVRIAVGGENIVIEYNGLAPNFKVRIPGNVHTVAYNEDGTHLIFGTSKGVLGLVDLRLDYNEKPTPLLQKVSNSSLIDSCFLSDEQIIVAVSNNRLQTFDLRNKKFVTSFLGHRHSVQKRPISVADNMICVSGADNVIRLWDINGGVPISEIRPEVPDRAIRGCINRYNNDTHLYYFEGSHEKIFEL